VSKSFDYTVGIDRKDAAMTRNKLITKTQLAVVAICFLAGFSFLSSYTAFLGKDQWIVHLKPLPHFLQFSFINAENLVSVHAILAVLLFYLMFIQIVLISFLPVSARFHWFVGRIIYLFLGLLFAHIAVLAVFTLNYSSFSDFVRVYHYALVAFFIVFLFFVYYFIRIVTVKLHISFVCIAYVYLSTQGIANTVLIVLMPFVPHLNGYVIPQDREAFHNTMTLVASILIILFQVLMLIGKKRSRVEYLPVLLWAIFLVIALSIYCPTLLFA